jgi:subtilisin
MVVFNHNMRTTKKLSICLLLAAFFAFIPLAHASADGGRYFVKSTKGFWKNAFGVRHEFGNGFTTDLSDFQVRFAKMFGADIEQVPTLQISPIDGDSLSAELSGKISPTPIPVSTKNLKKGVMRYIPSGQISWGIQTIYGDSKIASTSGGAGINIAVLDTGVNVSHPDLVGQITKCKDFTNVRYPVLDNKCQDQNGHGTHVAGIIAADAGSDHLGIYGVAPEAKIFAYKVCDIKGSCYADDIAAALRWAVSDGANVVNMSFGTSDDVSLIRDAVSYASSNGLLLVAAAGNSGPNNGSMDYPGAYASVIGVGALNQNLLVTDWSSRGINSTTTPVVIENGEIEFATPGDHVESTWNNGGYAILSGTSMASPFVAGLAAKYWQNVDTENSAQTTRELLWSMAKDILPGVGEDNASGFGLPQVK